jgi:hypothetical protein
MKTAITCLFLALLCAGQLCSVAAQSTAAQITKITTIDNFNHISVYTNRGFQAGAIIETNALNSGNYSICLTLYDSCNVPVAYSTNKIWLSDGVNHVTLNFSIAKYAYVGIGTLHITLFDSAGNSVDWEDVTVYIKILGDFDGNGIVSSDDVSFLISAYCSYITLGYITPIYKPCDINEDKKVDAADVGIFIFSYNLR